MAYLARHNYTGDGSSKMFAVSFPYLSTTHVEVTVGGVLKTLGTDYTFSNPAVISFVTAPAAGTPVVIKRNTPKNQRLVDFQDASVLTEEVLDQSSLQLFYITQEQLDEPVAAYENSQVAVDTANGAVTTANSAVSTANSAVTKADEAISIANTAKTDAVGSAAAAASSASAAAASATNAATSATQSATSATASATSATNAQTSANAAALSALNAQSSADASAGSASGASTQRSLAETAVSEAIAIRDSLVAGYQGIQPGTAYDLGVISDPLTFFNQDFGSIA